MRGGKDPTVIPFPDINLVCGARSGDSHRERIQHVAVVEKQWPACFTCLRTCNFAYISLAEPRMYWQVSAILSDTMFFILSFRDTFYNTVKMNVFQCRKYI